MAPARLPYALGRWHLRVPATDPDEALMAFLVSTYEAAADLRH